MREVIVVPLAVLDLVAAVAVLERHAVDEADLGADHLAALQVGDVDAFDDPRRLGKPERRPAARQPSCGLVTNAFGLPEFLGRLWRRACPAPAAP